MQARKRSLCIFRPGRLASTLLALVCLLPTISIAESKLEQITLQLKWKHQYQFAGYYMALEKGFYKEAGLDVIIRPHTGKKSPAETMLAGEADFAVTGSDVVIHRTKGAPVVALGAIFQHSAYGFLVRADSGITSVKDFIGRRVMMGTGSQDAALQATLKRAGIRPSDFTQLPSSFDVNSLLRGETDVFNAYVTDQRYRMEQAGVQGRHILPINYGVDFYGDILATTENEIRQHPERTQRFLQASLKGWEYALAHQDEAIDTILKKYNTQNMSYRHLVYEAHTTRELIQPLLIAIGHMNPARWEQIRSTLEELGFVDAGSSIEGLIYKSKPPVNPWVRWIADHGISLGIGTLVVYILILLLLLLKVHRQYRDRTAELAESEKQLRGAQEYANIGHWILRKDFCVDYWSDQVYRILGLDPSIQPSHEVIKGLLSEEDFIEFQQSLSNSMNTGEEHWIEYLVHRPDGIERWVECRGRPTIGPDGKPEKITGFVQDITERKQAEKELRTERDFAENLINLAQVIVLVLDTEGKIERFNPYMEEVSGYSLDEVKGKDWFSIFVPTSMQKVTRDLFQLAITNINTKGNINKIITKDGNQRDIEWYDKTITDAAGKTIGLLAIGQDITQRIQAEKEQQRLQSDLQRIQKMEAIGQLTGGVAHDFNNLLGIIIGNLDILKHEVIGNGPAMRHCESALRAALRGSDLTKRLLTFSSDSPQEATPHNINYLISDILNMIERSLTASIKVETKLEDELWLTTVNAGELEDSLINLTINARDAMPYGGQLNIETTNTTLDQENIRDLPELKAGEYVELIVRDNGSGIPEDILERIYEPFFTTKPQGQGTGLGLSMVHGFIQKVNGHIDITSEPGKGTAVRILLPRSTTAEQAAAKLAHATSTSKNETILVVDDEYDLALSTKVSLNRLGYKVLTANNATEALRLLQNNQNIDLMFSDVIMSGGMNGFDLAKEAKRQYPNLKILLASGFTQDKDHELFEEYGKGMLAKPYRSNEMTAKIRELLDRR